MKAIRQRSPMSPSTLRLVVRHAERLQNGKLICFERRGTDTRGFNGGFARRPMALPPRSDTRYAEIRQWLQSSFERAGIPLETA